MKCIRVSVCGHVQGVGFRWYTVREAERLGICGWVRNRSNGDVEALLYGEASKLDQLLQSLAEGPPLAQVLDLNWEECPAENIPATFEARQTE